MFSWVGQQPERTKQPVKMEETESIGTSIKSRMYFDAIDQARSLLESFSDLSDAVPSFVVVGMQSVGKSAVLRRISGIPFPQDSEVCTRVAMELRLRRCQENNFSRTTITAGVATPIAISEQSNVEKILKKCQMDVLRGKKFEHESSVKIDKSGANLPDLTLTDLPGVFFAKTDKEKSLEEQVKTMINTRVRNDMALICHVIPLNQDTDTISTWHIVHDADKDHQRTVSILTKADLVSSKEEFKKRIHKVMSGHDENTLKECFIVHGAAQDDDDETEKLWKVSTYVSRDVVSNCDRVKVGIPALKKCLEDRMLSHIQKKIPEMRRFLRQELSRCAGELDKIGRGEVSPVEASIRCNAAIIQSLQSLFEKQLPEFRKRAECLSENIEEIKMKPLGRLGLGDVKKIVKEKYGKSAASYVDDSTVCVFEVKQIGNDSRGFLNEAFAGTSEELRAWVKQFAEPCAHEVKTFVQSMFDSFRDKVLIESLENGSNEMMKDAIKDIIEPELVENVFASAYRKALLLEQEQREMLTGPDLYTTNHHYLVETAAALKTHVKSSHHFRNCPFSDDMLPYFETVCDIEAFLKVRKKQISDSVQQYTTLLLRKALDEIIERLHFCFAQERVHKLIREPSDIASKREVLLEREKSIKNAIDAISHL